MFKFKKDKKFSSNGRDLIDAKKGEEHDLNKYLACAFLANGTVEKVKVIELSEEEIPEDAEILEEGIEVDEINFMEIFKEDPTRLTVPELKDLCKKFEIKFHHASKEAKLISLIQEKLEA